MDITKEIGSRIRFHRKNKNLSQEELAGICNLHSSYIGQLERGIKTPSVDTVYRIVKSLDLTMADFLRNIENFDTKEDTFAMKSYMLIEKESLENQKRIYEIIKQIIEFKKNDDA